MIISLDKYKATGGGTKVEGDIAISENGIYDVTTYATANVNVQSSDNYSYFDGVVDVEGLRAIGWDDASIGMFRDNNPHYSWKNSDYIVSEYDKSLYQIINIHNVKQYRDFVFCPAFIIPDGNITMVAAFAYCKKLRGIPLLNLDGYFGSLASLFSGCTNLTSIPQLNTSKVTNMSSMFEYCGSLTSIPQLDTSKVLNMSSMFYNCSSLTSIPQLDTNNVVDMNSMFYNCSSLTSIPQLDTTKVTNTSSMFNNCSLLTSIPQLNTNIVMNMSYMFYNCSSLTSIPQLDTGNVTSMQNMFNGCTSLTYVPQLDASSVTNMSTIFGYGSIKTLTDLGGFKNLSISITSYFLENCPNLTVNSLMNVINNLATVSGKSLKFGSTNLNKLTPEQIAVATSKGWTLT